MVVTGGVVLVGGGVVVAVGADEQAESSRATIKTATPIRVPKILFISYQPFSLLLFLIH